MLTAFMEANAAFLRKAHQLQLSDGTTAVVALGLGGSQLLHLFASGFSLHHMVMPGDELLHCHAFDLLLIIDPGTTLWTAHVGDSKALVCNFSRPLRQSQVSEHSTIRKGEEEASTTSAIHLTEDHHPGLASEQRRIQAAGGYVQQTSRM